MVSSRHVKRKEFFSEIHGGHPVKEKRVFEKFFSEIHGRSRDPVSSVKSVTVKEKRVFEKFFSEIHRD